MKRVSVAVVGCGNRGLEAYGRWLAAHPRRARVAALVEPRPERMQRALRLFPDVPAARQFGDWRQLVDAPRLADGVILATQDRLHAEPAVACLRKGYHLLLEKPMAPSEEECRRIVREALSSGSLFAVAHVLRYAPHFQTIRALIDQGAIGEVVTIQHAEDVGYWHQAHSFVRGNWAREGEASFMLLAKSCHDIDLLRYYTGSRCRRVHSFGSLTHFRPENQPAEAKGARRCPECPFEPRCPFSALKIYLRDRLERGALGWPLHVLTGDLTEEGVLRALREGPYGVCVYAAGNDVVDHQVVNLEYEGGTTASFTMSAFNEGGRKSVVQGTRGLIRAEEGSGIRVLDFLADQWRQVPVPEPSGPGVLHSGGDASLLDAWVSAVRTGDPGGILSGPEESLETHLTTFAAERSRRLGTVETVRYSSSAPGRASGAAC
jgi:predicted dehydrogenase